MSTEPAVQAYWDQQHRLMTDNIRRYGVHLTYVGAPEDCACCRAGVPPDGPESPDVVADLVGGVEDLPERLSVPFCYTTGLFGVGHPELIVLGLSQLPAGVLLGQLAQHVLAGRDDLMPGEVIEMDGLKVLVEELPDPWMTTFQTFHYYDRPPGTSLPTYQLTWADPWGRFPWDDGHVPEPWPQRRPGRYRA